MKTLVVLNSLLFLQCTVEMGTGKDMAAKPNWCEDYKNLSECIVKCTAKDKSTTRTIASFFDPLPPIYIKPFAKSTKFMRYFWMDVPSKMTVVDVKTNKTILFRIYPEGKPHNLYDLDSCIEVDY